MRIPPWPAAQPVATNAIIPVRFQRPAAGAPQGLPDDARVDYPLQLEPPGLERLQRLDTDAQLQERIRQETHEREGKEAAVVFPEEPILSRDVYHGRAGLWPKRNILVEPNFVTYHRLYFQDLNTERYGWDFGAVSPALSLAKFYYDLALLPLHVMNDPCGNDCSTGYCLPGDPVPFAWYPPEITFKGTVAEIGVILALVAIFP